MAEIVAISFSALYAAVKKTMPKSTSPQLIRDLVSKLESLEPLIYEIEENNRIFDREDKDLREAKQLLQDGKLLVTKYGGQRKSSKKKKYTEKLVILNKSLTTLLERLRDLKMELLMRQQIDEQRRANERYETLINTADPVVEPHDQPDNQIQADQAFLRRIQNWVVNRSYGLWAILFILFSVIMVMTAGGSAGTKWVVLNVGINYLGINNY